MGDDEAAALELAEVAVQARLAVSAQVEGPITSVYRCEGEIHYERQWRLVLTTRSALADHLVLHVRALHEHEAAEIVVIPILGTGAEHPGRAASGHDEPTGPVTGRPEARP